MGGFLGPAGHALSVRVGKKGTNLPCPVTMEMSSLPSGDRTILLYTSQFLNSMGQWVTIGLAVETHQACCLS